MSRFAACVCGDFIESAIRSAPVPPNRLRALPNARIRRRMHACEIIYVKDAQAKGWKWRALVEEGELRPETSAETFQLFYDCVSAARTKGYRPNVKCP